MSDNTVETSDASTMGTSPDSHLPPHNSSHLGQEIISLFDDSDPKRVSGNFLE